MMGLGDFRTHWPVAQAAIHCLRLTRALRAHGHHPRSLLAWALDLEMHCSISQPAIHSQVYRSLVRHSASGSLTASKPEDEDQGWEQHSIQGACQACSDIHAPIVTMQACTCKSKDDCRRMFVPKRPFEELCNPPRLARKTGEVHATHVTARDAIMLPEHISLSCK